MVTKVDTVQGAADTTPPTAIVNVVGFSRSPTITLSGVASDDPGGSGVAMVTVFDTFGGFLRQLGQPALNVDGSWRFTTPYLADGSHDFFVSVVDKQNNYAAIHLSPVQVDTRGPTLTAGASATGTTAGRGIVLSGTAIDSQSGIAGVEVFDVTAGRMLDLGAATLDGGTWRFTAGQLVAGFHSFSAVAFDKAGNASSASTGEPLQVVLATTLNPTIQRIIGNVDGGVTLLGTSEANSTVSITDTTAGVSRSLGWATTDAAGAFSLMTHDKISVATVNTFTAHALNAGGQQGASTGLFQLASIASETLFGTSGQSDVFATFLRTGQDVISGFESTRSVGASHDVINLSGTGYGSYGQVAPHIGGTASAVIQLDATRSITLSNVSAGSLQASDFRFS